MQHRGAACSGRAAAAALLAALAPLPRAPALAPGTRRGHAPAALSGAPGTRRAHAQASQIPTLKQRLRELYHRVHPDKLGQTSQEAQDQNASSFAALQDFLRGGGSTGRPRPTQLAFYLQEEGISVSGGPSLRRIERVLPALPPSPDGYLPPAALAGVARLLEAAGVAPDFAPPHAAAPGGTTPTSAEALVTLLRSLVAETHKASFDLDAVRRGGSCMASVEAAALCRAAARRRGVSVRWSAALTTSATHRRTAARRLARALDLAPDARLNGLTLLVGARELERPDAHGTLWLDAGCGGASSDDSDDGNGDSASAATIERWAAALNSISESAILQGQAEAAVTELGERDAASCLGVELVHAGAAVRASELYSTMLRALAVAGRRAPLEGLEDLLVCVVAAGDEWAIDEDMGYVAVPLSAPIDEVVDFLRARGGQAVAARRENQRRRKVTIDLAAHAAQKLRARAVTVDGSLTVDESTRALTRLMRHAPTLGPILQGVALHVGHSTRAIGGAVELEHNFSL